MGVYSEIYPHDITVEELKALPNVKGIIINGGPNNVIDGVAIDVNPGIYSLGIPVMAAGQMCIRDRNILKVQQRILQVLSYQER